MKNKSTVSRLLKSIGFGFLVIPTQAKATSEQAALESAALNNDIVNSLIVDGSIQVEASGGLTASPEVWNALVEAGVVGTQQPKVIKALEIDKSGLSLELREQMILDSLKRNMHPENFERFMRNRDQIHHVRSMSFSGPA